LTDLFLEYGIVEDVRAMGMMLGMEMSMPCASMVDEMRQQGVLVNCTAGNVLRFVPPLVITTEQINEVTDSLDEVLRRISD
jgi:acetylornithine/N-succinyldiaminopimelate aminotransferase